MNPDVDQHATRRRDLDDDQLGAMVRSAVEAWQMPPQRIDQPTWRDRTRARDGRRRWPARLARSGMAALVATVVLAVAAVWLTAPRNDRGVVGPSQAPTAAPSASPSSGPAVTPLPKLLRNGELPSVTRVMLRAGGRYQLADLATGDLVDGGLGRYDGPLALVPRPDGGWLCVCGAWQMSASGPSGLTMDLVPVDADGNAGTPTPARSLEGEADPALPADRQFALVDGNVAVSPDQKTALFSWSVRNGADGWAGGVDVIDVAAGSVVGNAAVPFEPITTEGPVPLPVTRNAPNVSFSPDGSAIVLAAFWFVEDPADPSPPYGLDRWTAPFDGSAIGDVSRLALQTASQCDEFDRGLVDASTYYSVCSLSGGEILVRRFSLDGTLLGDTSLARAEGELSGAMLEARSGDDLYLWNPVPAVLSKVDLRTGELRQSAQPTARSGPLDGLAELGRRVGHWIAPTAVAKIWLEPGLAITPDGSRVYAIGVSSINPNEVGSTGVYAFDANSLASVGHWQPTADFTSIAVSADGRFVYAAGFGGLGAPGGVSGNRASVTVFDTADGSIRLIAGQLTTGDIWFSSPVLR
jgi:hypothetical protein